MVNVCAKVTYGINRLHLEVPESFLGCDDYIPLKNIKIKILLACFHPYHFKGCAV